MPSDARRNAASAKIMIMQSSPMYFSQLMFLTLFVCCCRSQGKEHQNSIPDPHHHVVAVHEKPWHNELAPDARFVPLSQTFKITDSLVSPGRSWCAFIREKNEEEVDRVCILEVRTGKRYQLAGIPLPYRPISGLVWLNDHLLAFDRWSQPHYGIHYVVDVQKYSVVLSAPFPDSLMLQRQGSQDTVRQNR